MDHQMVCCLLGICCGRAAREQLLFEQGFTAEQVAWTIGLLDSVRTSVGSAEDLRKTFVDCTFYPKEEAK